MNKAPTLGYTTTYMNCFNACKELQEEFYGGDKEQYFMLRSYIQALNGIGHHACIEMTGESFFRLALIFREGIHTLQHYVSRGLCVGGTLVKSIVGGTLLVACFCSGNMELQIVAIAVVSIENHDNWFLFLKFLLAHLIRPPAFIASDRDKGLIPAVRAIESINHHLYCFRHILETSIRKSSLSN